MHTIIPITQRTRALLVPFKPNYNLAVVDGKNIVQYVDEGGAWQATAFAEGRKYRVLPDGARVRFDNVRLLNYSGLQEEDIEKLALTREQLYALWQAKYKESPFNADRDPLCVLIEITPL